MQIVTILEPLKNYFKLRKQKFLNQRAQTEIIPIKKCTFTKTVNSPTDRCK